MKKKMMTTQTVSLHPILMQPICGVFKIYELSRSCSYFPSPPPIPSYYSQMKHTCLCVCVNHTYNLIIVAGYLVVMTFSRLKMITSKDLLNTPATPTPSPPSNRKTVRMYTALEGIDDNSQTLHTYIYLNICILKSLNICRIFFLGNCY
jgi:hypothetical protein